MAAFICAVLAGPSEGVQHLERLILRMATRYQIPTYNLAKGGDHIGQKYFVTRYLCFVDLAQAGPVSKLRMP